MAVIGIDVGGTGLKGGIVDANGNLSQVTSVRTPVEEGRDGILQAIYALADRLKESAPEAVQAIGIGSAGRIDPVKGHVVYATKNLPGWTGTPLAALVEERCGLKTFVDNDVNAAAMGEAWMGAAKGCGTFAFLALGTGVGGAIVHDGQLVHGVRGGGGEFGHMILHPGGHPCNCGQFGCLEQYVSGTALNRSAQRIHPDWTSKILMEKCISGDAEAVRAVDAFAKDLAAGLVSIYHAADPAVIVLGGGLIDAKTAWWDRLQQELAKMTPKDVRLAAAALGNRAGMIGAAKLAMDRL